MINSIIKAIHNSLDAEFGSRYKIHSEEEKQGLNEPCFFIFCLNPANTLVVGGLYRRVNQFCIHYFPESRLHGNKECREAAERLFRCLEYLEAGGHLIRGTKMKYEIVDGILHFFVNYDLFTRKAADPIPAMEELSTEVSAKGQVTG